MTFGQVYDIAKEHGLADPQNVRLMLSEFRERGILVYFDEEALREHDRTSPLSIYPMR